MHVGEKQGKKGGDWDQWTTESSRFHREHLAIKSNDIINVFVARWKFLNDDKFGTNVKNTKVVTGSYFAMCNLCEF